MTHLIGTWVGDIDDTSSQLGLQVVNKGSLKSLSLVEDIVLISSTRQSQEKTEVAVPLQGRHGHVLSTDDSLKRGHGEQQQGIPSFSGLRSPVVKPLVSSSEQS